MTFSKRSKVVLGTLLAAWIPVLVVCEPAILRSIKMRLSDTRYVDSSGRPLKTFFAGLQPQPGIRGRRPQGRRQQAPQCTNHSGTFWRVMDALGLEDIVFAQSGCTPTTCCGCDDYVYELPCPGGCTGCYYNSWYEDVTAGLTEGYKQNNSGGFSLSNVLRTVKGGITTICAPLITQSPHLLCALRVTTALWITLS